MRKIQSFRRLLSIVFFLGLVAYADVRSQGLEIPLTMQGIDNRVLPSVASRSMGGLLFSQSNDVSLMFNNPASMSTLKGLQVSVAGLQQFTNTSQTQQWYPQKYYPGLSLLMEGLTDLIGNPDPSKPGVVFRNAGDTVQRPFDKIPPDWSESKNKFLPLQAQIGMPFTLGDMQFAASVGMIQYANLTSHYQNNNVLTPDIGSQRPTPILLPPATDSVHAYWYQYVQSRDGSINGYGAALSTTIMPGLSVGANGMVLNGSTNDNESEVGRGTMFFVYSPQNYFAVDSIYSHISRTGTSDYSGMEFTLSAEYRGKYVILGAAVTPPTVITRKFNTQIITDSMGVHSDQSVSGQDDVTLPWRGTVGFAIALREDLTLGFNYEFRPFASVVYKNQSGLKSNPWLSAALMHLGAEYVAAPWLTLRAGVREQATVFQEEGAPIVDQPIKYSVYSAGLGFSFDALKLDVVYEYSDLKYQDMWATNVNLNEQTTNIFAASLYYTLGQ